MIFGAGLSLVLERNILPWGIVVMILGCIPMASAYPVYTLILKRNKIMVKNFHPFKDMAESARAQHQADKANFEAAKAEARANFEEAKLSPAARQAKMQREREARIAGANARKAAAEERIAAAKNPNDKN